MTMPTGSRWVFACGSLLISLCEGVLADVSVSIRGTILPPPPCIINAGSTLDVPFGNDLMTTRIDGVTYQRAVPYTVTCGPQPSNDMKISLQGTGAGFDSTVLSTSKSDLGIKLLIGGVAWPLNSAVNFTYPTLPIMAAVPVKNPGSTLTGGIFTAAATLVVALQ